MNRIFNKTRRIKNWFYSLRFSSIPKRDYFSVLPFLIITQQHYIKPQCFFFQNKPQRNKMESRVAVVQYQANSPIEDTYSCEQINEKEGYFISVFDGHGGWQLSNYAKENLSQFFKNSLHENMGNKQDIDENLIIKSIKEAYNKLEKSFYKIVLEAYNLGFPQLSRVGSCALSIYVRDNKLFVANLGDCKAVLYRKEEGKLVPVKLNHKLNANSKKEQAKLREKYPEDKDIFVCRRGDNSACYVKNSLQPTRSFGDFRLKYPEFNNPQNRNYEYNYPKKIQDFKGPYILDEPEINVVSLTNKDLFIVMGSDGLWDELDKDEVGKIVYENQKKDKNEIAEKVFTFAFEKAAQSNKMSVSELRKVPSGPIRRKKHDDITLIVVDLKNQAN